VNVPLLSFPLWVSSFLWVLKLTLPPKLFPLQ